MKLNGRTIWGIIGVVVVAAAIFAVSSSGTSRNGTAVTTTALSSGSSAPGGTGGSVAPAEYQPVTITGEPLPVMPEGGTDPGIGSKVPVVTGYNFAGDPVSLDVAASARPTMVVFLAHWCPHCNAEIPRLIEWQQSGAVPSDLRVIGVSTGVASDRPNYPPSDWVVAKQWPWPVMADSEGQDAAIAYGVSGYPFFAIVGADGKIKVRASGEVEIDALNQIVTDALAD